MYFSLFDGAGTGTWTQPAPIASTPVRSVSPPSVAAVPCGAGAVVAFVDGSTTPTEIRISRFQGPGWSLPETVPALTGLAHVGIAAKSETSPALSP
jgi:hypothetical protein